jgi:hypothetical protein
MGAGVAIDLRLIRRRPHTIELLLPIASRRVVRQPQFEMARTDLSRYLLYGRGDSQIVEKLDDFDSLRAVRVRIETDLVPRRRFFDLLRTRHIEAAAL